MVKVEHVCGRTYMHSWLLQEYVEYYGGAGVQHIALNTSDIINAVSDRLYCHFAWMSLHSLGQVGVAVGIEAWMWLPLQIAAVILAASLSDMLYAATMASPTGVALLAACIVLMAISMSNANMCP